MTTVVVHNDEVDQALMVLRKKVQREGVLKIFRAKRYHEKTPKKLRLKAEESSKRKVRKRKMTIESDA